MNQNQTVAHDLLQFIRRATSPFQVVAEARRLLDESGFEALDFASPWQLTPGRSYYTTPYDTTLFAFTIGGKFCEGNPIHLACAHTDHPCLRVKPQPEMCDHGYKKLNVEVYGGAILYTWLDRPLSAAGKITLKSNDIYHPDIRLVDFTRPLLTIPSLAIHMNPEINKGKEFNKQTELLPLIGLVREQLETEHFFTTLLAEECGVSPEDILDFDIYLYNAEEGCLLGADHELLSAPRLDNLTSCYACLTGIAAASDSAAVSNRLNVIALYDNEEVGSRTKQGADSMLTSLLMDKIYDGLSFNHARLADSYFRSFLLSLDTAHAYHPNFGQKNDPNLITVCGQGPVLKLNYNQRYATDTEAIAVVEQLCRANDIPYQKYVNRSDITGGGTLGTITTAFLPMKAVDLGVGILAMHSSRELMGADDQLSLNTLVYSFFL